MKFYYAIGRLIGPIVVAILQWYSRVTGKPRARVVVINEHDEVLLVRNWAGTSYLELPGGGVERHETLADAAKRELFEETGIEAGDMVDIGEITIRYPARIFTARVTKDQLPVKQYNRWEIIEIGWHAVGNLPADTSPLACAALQKVSK